MKLFSTLKSVNPDPSDPVQIRHMKWTVVISLQITGLTRVQTGF